MAFDSFIAPNSRVDRTYSFDSAHAELVNFYLDSHHPRAEGPLPEEQPPSLDTISGVISDAARNGFSDSGSRLLGNIFLGDLARNWWNSEPAVDVVNKRLADANSPYRVRLDGPFNSSAPNTWEYRLIVTNTDGKALTQLALPYMP